MKLQDGQLEQFERAAKSSGKTVASWLRDLGAAAIAPPAQVREAPAHGYPGPPSNVDEVQVRRNGPPIIAVDPGAAPADDYWARKFAYWDSRDQAGRAEKAEALAELGLPPNITKVAAQLVWLRQHRAQP